MLELACGTGRITLPIAQAGFEITGLDISEGMLSYARKRSKDLNLPITWVHGDVRKFNLRKKKAESRSKNHEDQLSAQGGKIPFRNLKQFFRIGELEKRRNGEIPDSPFLRFIQRVLYFPFQPLNFCRQC